MGRYKDYTKLAKIVGEMCAQKGMCMETPSQAADLKALYANLEHIDQEEREVYSKYRDLPLEQLKYKPIDILWITPRASNCLGREGIKTIGDLINMSAEEILSIRWLGVFSYYSIMVHMNLLGFKCGDHGWAKIAPNVY